MNVLLINGPNLNLLGLREPEVYGSTTYDELIEHLSNFAEKQQINLKCMQSNAEHEIIDAIHQARAEQDFVIINPAAYTHTSVAIRDALAGVDIPFIEVHISNVHAREEFRHHSFLSDIAQGVICGLGLKGYEYALMSAQAYINQHK